MRRAAIGSPPYGAGVAEKLDWVIQALVELERASYENTPEDEREASDGAYQPLDPTLTGLAGLDSTLGIVVQSAVDTFLKRVLTPPAAGITITNPAGTAGNFIFALANDLAALEASTGTGFAARIASDSWARRSLTSSANHLSITEPAGVGGNPVLDLAAGVLIASSWTPTLTGVANVDSTTAFLSYYIRVGPIVVCMLSVTVDATAATTVTQVGISLPVASNFTIQQQCFGTMNSNGVEAGRIVADSTNDRAELRYTSAGTGATAFFGMFGYVVL